MIFRQEVSLLLYIEEITNIMNYLSSMLVIARLVAVIVAAVGYQWSTGRFGCCSSRHSSTIQTTECCHS